MSYIYYLGLYIFLSIRLFNWAVKFWIKVSFVLLKKQNVKCKSKKTQKPYFKQNKKNTTKVKKFKLQFLTRTIFHCRTSFQ
jgi:hypothetical protein